VVEGYQQVVEREREWQLDLDLVVELWPLVVVENAGVVPRRYGGGGAAPPVDRPQPLQLHIGVALHHPHLDTDVPTAHTPVVVI
jgi:hypothetical protein